MITLQTVQLLFLPFDTPCVVSSPNLDEVVCVLRVLVVVCFERFLLCLICFLILIFYNRYVDLDSLIFL